MKKCLCVLMIFSVIFSNFISLSFASDSLKYESGHYVIEKPEDFNNITDMSADYWIISDMELKDYIPVGTPANPFRGKLIGRLKGEKGKKPTITVDISSDGNQALVANMSGGLIENIILKGKVEAENKNIAAGFVGRMKSGKLKGLENHADISSTCANKKVYLGGIVAFSDSPSYCIIDDCINYGNITCNTSLDGYIGGIAGFLSNSTDTVNNSLNSGDVSGTVKYVGGIAGHSLADIKYCANNGNVSADSGIAGGICGYGSQVSHSFNQGNILALGYAGGIAGEGNFVKEYTINYNTGNVTSEKQSASGIVSDCKVKYSYNIGGISGFKNSYAISSYADKTNYTMISYEDKNVIWLTEEQFRNPDSFSSFKSDNYRIDKDAEYIYPQIIGNPFGTVLPDYTPFINGKLFVEAEDCNIISKFVVSDEPSASGKKIITSSKTYNTLTIDGVNEPSLTFDLYVEDAAKYFIWARLWAKDASSDSVWCAIDDEEYTNCSAVVDAGSYIWVRIKSAELEKGVHTINLHPREAQLIIDKIGILSKVTETPSGFGSYELSEGPSTELFFPKPSHVPSQGHPRVMFKEEDIAEIRENLNHYENQFAYDMHLKNIKKETDGILPDTGKLNLNQAAIKYIRHYAFEYVLSGNEQMGKKAINAIKNYMDTIYLPTHTYYSYAEQIIYTAACVYDWCYPLLSEKDKSDLVEKALYVAGQFLELGWPPVKQTGMGDHGSEKQLLRGLLALGIATYDEYPFIYENCLGRIEKDYIEYRKFFYDMHKTPYGSWYMYTRFDGDCYSQYMMNVIGLKDLWQNDNMRYVPYYSIYTARPDGYFMDEGDARNNYSSAPSAQTVQPIDMYLMLADYYKDGYIKDAMMRFSEISQYDFDYILWLICNDTDLERKPVEELPLSKYFGFPSGSYIARTSWEDGKDSPAVIAHFKMNEINFTDHNHWDAGGFQIYYKGNLATDSGYYHSNTSGSTEENTGNNYYNSLHYLNYYRQTIAHNCMLVYDPSENKTNFYNSPKYGLNSGGQKAFTDPVNISDYYTDAFRAATVLGHEIGTDVIKPDYTYLKGDLSKSYSGKVSDYERSFMFLNLDNEKTPGALVVFDRVKSSDANYKKTWLLHSVNAPVIEGTRTTVSMTDNGYNGRLICDTLLPENPSIKQVGDDPTEYWAAGDNWWTPGVVGSLNEGGGIRTEVSPGKQSREDYFLNVIQVGDSGEENIPLTSEIVKSDTHSGAKIADRVVLFGNQKERYDKKVSFEFSGEGTFKILVADLSEGLWQITKDGEKLCDVFATEEGGVASFEGSAGKYELYLVSENGKKEFSSDNSGSVDYTRIKVNEFFVYSDVKPEIVNGRTMVPAGSVMKHLNAQADIDLAKETCVVERYGRKVTYQANSNTAYLNETKELKLDIAPYIKNGEFMIPLRHISEIFNTKVSWSQKYNTVYIKDDVRPPVDGYLSVVDCESYSGTIEESNPLNTIDGNASTNWTSSESESDDKWIIYDFDEPVSFRGMEVLWGRPHQRSFYFDVYVSDDKENWKAAVTGGESELVSEDKKDAFQSISFPRGIKGKYIKFVLKGNSNTYANNVIEVRFPE